MIHLHDVIARQADRHRIAKEIERFLASGGAVTSLNGDDRKERKPPPFVINRGCVVDITEERKRRTVRA